MMCPSRADPYITSITFSSFTPSSTPPEAESRTSSGSGSGSADNETTFGEGPSPMTLVNLTLGANLLPGTYYITVEAISASGQRARSTSNGVLIDTTPPELALPVEQFDVRFSSTQATRYQGNNDTISARWLFIDAESGIVGYEWAIGTTPYGEDIQSFVSVTVSTQAINSSLELIHNTTYYVTVRARNGAGLSQVATSTGITYLAVELNRTQLDMTIILEHTRELVVAGPNGTAETIMASTNAQRARIEWRGITDDVDEICKRDNIVDTYTVSP